MKSSILKSWKKNAKEWNSTIEKGFIPSRKFTNKAIMQAVTNLKLEKVVDLGCGEGWLVREMTKLGIEANGFDATPELIQLAKEKGPEIYRVLEFEHLIKGNSLPNSPYDGAIFNFSLYQKEGVDLLLKNTLDNLTNDGVLFIQTLHPYFLIRENFGYADQWILDSWKGLPGTFVDAHSFYMRTFAGWQEEFVVLKNVLASFEEILDGNGMPISLIIKLKKQL